MFTSPRGVRRGRGCRVGESSSLHRGCNRYGRNDPEEKPLCRRRSPAPVNTSHARSVHSSSQRFSSAATTAAEKKSFDLAKLVFIFMFFIISFLFYQANTLSTSGALTWRNPLENAAQDNSEDPARDVAEEIKWNRIFHNRPMNNSSVLSSLGKLGKPDVTRLFCASVLIFLFFFLHFFIFFFSCFRNIRATSSFEAQSSAVPTKGPLEPRDLSRASLASLSD